MSRNMTEISAKDTQFLTIMKKGASKVKGHYQLPLPVKNHDITMPNKKPKVERRWSCSKWRFFGDFSSIYEDLEEDYERINLKSCFKNLITQKSLVHSMKKCKSSK